MNKIWSDNRYVNIAVNVLLFLVGINFFHYGQLFLPMICFILFLDNRLQFKVNNPLVFIVLCLFAVSFYAFSNKDFYSVMGFTLPMAYYIGSNIKDPDSDKIRKIIYLLAVSMSVHVVLNSIYEFIVHGWYRFFNSSTHYDFWTRDKISNTSTAINIDLLLGSMYYLFFHEKDKKLRTGCIALFVISMFYLVVIGRRTPIVMLFIIFALSFFYELFFLKSVSAKLKKNFTILAATAVGFIVFIIVIYAFNLFNCRAILDNTRIMQKFTKGFINDQRFELFFGSFALMPKYPFGGQHISAALGEQVHDFWIDIYDYAGIVSWALMVIYSLMYAKVVIRLFRSDRIDQKLRILLAGVFAAIIIQMFLEPVMTGASIFLIVGIIINAVCERLLLDEE